MWKRRKTRSTRDKLCVNFQSFPCQKPFLMTAIFNTWLPFLLACCYRWNFGDTTLMYQSNQSFNTPPPGQPPGIWIFGKFFFKFPLPRAEKLFKCPHPHVPSGEGRGLISLTAAGNRDIEASDQIPHPLWVVIKFPSSRAGKGVKCPGYARGGCWSFDLTGT